MKEIEVSIRPLSIVDLILETEVSWIAWTKLYSSYALNQLQMVGAIFKIMYTSTCLKTVISNKPKTSKVVWHQQVAFFGLQIICEV